MEEDQASFIAMKPNRWPDFLFTVAVRLVCGAALGMLVCVLWSYRDILRSFSDNHIGSVGVWMGLWGIVGGIVAVFTIPRWQTPWYQSVRCPAGWFKLKPGITRQRLLARLGEPSGWSAPGEDTWQEGAWQLLVTYDEGGRAIAIVRTLATK